MMKKILAMLGVLAVILFVLAAQSWADLVSWSNNPNVIPGPIMYEDRTGPGVNPDPGWNGKPYPFFTEYGSAPKTVFTPEDHVYFGVALSLDAMEETDMMNIAGTKYLPKYWLQLWAPGVDTTGNATWEYIKPSYTITWAQIQSLQGSGLWYRLNSYFDTFDPSDLWTLGGGFQPGQWNFRISLEAPSEGGDPWRTALPGGTWSDSWSDPANAPMSGSATAAVVPEPSTLLLLGSGLAGLAFARKRMKR